MNLKSKNETPDIIKYIQKLEIRQSEMEKFVREIAVYQQDMMALVDILAGMLTREGILSEVEIRTVLDLKLKEIRAAGDKRIDELQKELKIKQLFDGYCAQS